ncbi:MAG: hypothetical protein WB767_16105 [Nocardioides sp.]
MSSETSTPARPALSRDTPVADSCRQAAKASGPLGVVALASFIGSLVATGGDSLELATSPLSIAASVLGVTALIALTIGMFSIAADHPALHSGSGRVGWLIALIGTVLAAGGQWAQLFVLPGLAGPAPDLATNGIDSVVAGYIASYIVLGVGWLIVGITLLRSGAATKGLAWFLIIGAVLCIPPLPVRFVFVTVAVSLLARRTAARG